MGQSAPSLSQQYGSPQARETRVAEALVFMPSVLLKLVMGYQAHWKIVFQGGFLISTQALCEYDPIRQTWEWDVLDSPQERFVLLSNETSLFKWTETLEPKCASFHEGQGGKHPWKEWKEKCVVRITSPLATWPPFAPWPVLCSCVNDSSLFVLPVHPCCQNQQSLEGMRFDLAQGSWGSLLSLWPNLPQSPSLEIQCLACSPNLLFVLLRCGTLYILNLKSGKWTKGPGVQKKIGELMKAFVFCSPFLVLWQGLPANTYSVLPVRGSSFGKKWVIKFGPRLSDGDLVVAVAEAKLYIFSIPHFAPPSFWELVPEKDLWLPLSPPSFFDQDHGYRWTPRSAAAVAGL